MSDIFSRTEALLGKANMDKLKNAHVAIFGIGGVGSYVCEAIARCGIYNVTLIDSDNIDTSNLNRQLHATIHTIGMDKTAVMKERMLSINDKMVIATHNKFVTPDNINDFLHDYDFVADCIDTTPSKIALICACYKKGIPIISSMGTGNKLQPELLELTDIYKTSVCPLAKKVRYELKKHGIKNLPVCYSKEEPLTPTFPDGYVKEGERIPPGSISFVPSAAGLLIASYIVRTLLL